LNYGLIPKAIEPLGPDNLVIGVNIYIPIYFYLKTLQLTCLWVVQNILKEACMQTVTVEGGEYYAKSMHGMKQKGKQKRSLNPSC